MISKNLDIKRDYVQDYEIITKEVSTKTVKLFGIIIFKDIIAVKNSNSDSSTSRKPTGFKLSSKDHE